MTPGLLIFDCDGVLVDSERLVSRVESELLGELGLSIEPRALSALLKGKTVEEVARIVEQRVGRALPPGFWYGWAMAIAHGFVQELREVPGVRAVLERAAAAGVPVCVASQSLLPRVRLSLRVTALDGFFGEHLYTAAMVARGKPAPDLFLHAAAQLGIAPQSCAVIEDSPSGAIAARAAGMTVFGYAADEDAAALAGAGAHVFMSMQELPALLGLD
jgi:HAD superfamily hydrolase (TIGR01509 family)